MPNLSSSVSGLIDKAVSRSTGGSVNTASTRTRAGMGLTSGISAVGSDSVVLSDDSGALFFVWDVDDWDDAAKFW
jgi:hypothetical protein